MWNLSIYVYHTNEYLKEYLNNAYDTNENEVQFLRQRIWCVNVYEKVYNLKLLHVNRINITVHIL